MRKSLVKTLAVTMAAVMCAGMVSGCGAGSESKKADTQAEAPGTGDSKTADKSYELTVSGIGGSLNYLPIYIAERLGYRLHRRGRRVCRRSGIRCAGPWIQ